MACAEQNIHWDRCPVNVSPAQHAPVRDYFRLLPRRRSTPGAGENNFCLTFSATATAPGAKFANTSVTTLPRFQLTSHHVAKGQKSDHGLAHRHTSTQ